MSSTQRGYGFVHYSPTLPGILSALKCVNELRDSTSEGIHFKCDLSHKLMKQLSQRQDKEEIKIIHQYFPEGFGQMQNADETRSVQQREINYAARGNINIRTNITQSDCDAEYSAVINSNNRGKSRRRHSPRQYGYHSNPNSTPFQHVDNVEQTAEIVHSPYFQVSPFPYFPYYYPGYQFNQFHQRQFEYQSVNNNFCVNELLT